jgi:hypothetical protein
VEERLFIVKKAKLAVGGLGRRESRQAGLGAGLAGVASGLPGHRPGRPAWEPANRARSRATPGEEKSRWDKFKKRSGGKAGAPGVEPDHPVETGLVTGPAPGVFWSVPGCARRMVRYRPGHPARHPVRPDQAPDRPV